jgi:hypothetical protein
MNLEGFEQLRLVGDEDCGVDLQCCAAECWDGGRPQAYYVGNTTYWENDPKVTVVHTIAELIAAGRAHLDERHKAG